MVKKYEHFLVFDETYIKSINNNIEKNIDCRLYLAAYYNPKRISANTSSEYDFWVGVTNIYAFFSDCSGYIKYDFLNLLKQQKLIDKDNVNKIRNFIKTVEAIRLLFCHNITTESLETENHLNTFNDFIHQGLQKDTPSISIPYKLTLKSDDWEKLIISLGEEFKECIYVLYESVTEISMHKNKAAIINEWITYIAQWYENSSLFHLVANSYYRLLSQIDSVNYPLASFKKKSWIQKRKEEWHKNSIAFVLNTQKPMLPYQILSAFFHDAVANSQIE